MGFGPTTSSLEGWRSTAELHPQNGLSARPFTCISGFFRCSMHPRSTSIPWSMAAYPSRWGFPLELRTRWWSRQDSDLHIALCKSAASPLGYGPVKKKKWSSYDALRLLGFVASCLSATPLRRGDQPLLSLCPAYACHWGLRTSATLRTYWVMPGMAPGRRDTEPVAQNLREPLRVLLPGMKWLQRQDSNL